jgi:hypothetical protein
MHRVYSRLDYLKNEKIVCVHHLRIGNFAFEIGVALVDEWSIDG